MMNGGGNLAQQCLIVLHLKSAMDEALPKQFMNKALQLRYTTCNELKNGGG
jgi:hypothetical protein